VRAITSDRYTMSSGQPSPGLGAGALVAEMPMHRALKIAGVSLATKASPSPSETSTISSYQARQLLGVTMP